MEANWLISRLENPALLEKGDERHLRELIAAYPYFSAPYLLLAKSLKSQNHPAFDDLLPLISLHAFDRKRLFRLVYEEQEAEVKVEVKAEFKIEEAEVREVVEEIIYDDVLSTYTLEPVVESIEVSEGEVELEAMHVSETKPRFDVNFAEVEKTGQEEEEASHQELREIPFLMEVREVEAEVDAEVEVEDEIEMKVEEVSALEEINEEMEPESASIESAWPLAEEGVSEKIDFLHWLEKLEPVKVKIEPLVEIKAEVDETQVEHKMEEVNPPFQSIEPYPAELIDKFIENNPSVSRVKERFYDPVVQAKESERLDDSMLTETMAKILVKQMKFERAIAAYEKLQLKYPEKRDYFATLIAEINSKIN